MRFQNKQKRRGHKSAYRSPPLITFAELFEQALAIHQHRNSLRKVKIYFDSNDEFVTE
jgi:hypothetical protein